MRIITIVLLLLINSWAISEIESEIPVTKDVFIDLGIEKCDDNCLSEYLNRGFIFSFLAKYRQNRVKELALKEAYENLKTLFNIGPLLVIEPNGDRKIAILIPERRVGKYAITTVNSVISYLILKKKDFDLEVFYTGNENEESIISALEKIREEGISFVIAPVTTKGARVILENASELMVYIPTLNQDFLGSYQYNVFYGGVDYIKQIQELLPYAKNGLSIFKTKSPVSQNLTEIIKANYDNILYEREIRKNSYSIKNAIRMGKKYLNGASLFLNTPLVKTAVILAQLRAENITPYSILSTQINYNPNIFTLTQLEDRKSFLIANSIMETDFKLVEINKMLYSDIKYNWINYSTSIGIDFIYNKYFNETKIFNETMEENQVNYNISIIRPLDGSFRVLPPMR